MRADVLSCITNVVQQTQCSILQHLFLEPWLFVILLKRTHDPVTSKPRSQSRPPRRPVSTELHRLRTEQRYSPLLHHLNGKFVVNHSGLVTLTVELRIQLILKTLFQSWNTLMLLIQKATNI